MFQKDHDVLPKADHDEFSRQEFCGAMRKFFTETLWPGNYDVYKGKMRPQFEREHGREPNDEDEVQALMRESFYYRASSLFGRCAQEILWDTVGECIERQLPELIEKAKPKPGARGSLRLNPDIPIPKYVQAVDIHVMPGNFHTELGEDDVMAGALYDRGVYYFGYGGQGEEGDKLGWAMINYLGGAFPDFKPKRVLDVGCGVGFSTLPWKKAFPDAEVQGVDIAAPMLRYAHARAESLGVEAHFSQQDATRTDFPDGYFDVVVLCLVTHECPLQVNKAIFREANRVLAPGGMLLVDGGPRPKAPVEQQHFSGWFNHNVNEPFAVGMRRATFPEVLIEAGFDADKTFESGRQPAVFLQGMNKSSAAPKGVGFAYAGAFKS